MLRIRRLRLLRSGIAIVLHLRKREVRVHDAEIADRVHFYGDVVPRDNVLRRLRASRPQRHAIEVLNGPEADRSPAGLASGSIRPSRKTRPAPIPNHIKRFPEPDQKDQ